MCFSFLYGHEVGGEEVSPQYETKFRPGVFPADLVPLLLELRQIGLVDLQHLVQQRFRLLCLRP